MEVTFKTTLSKKAFVVYGTLSVISERGSVRREGWGLREEGMKRP